MTEATGTDTGQNSVSAGTDRGPGVAGRISPEEAAALLFDDRGADIDFEATTDEEAWRAVEEFARIFEQLPGTVKDIVEGAKAGAQTLSGDPLQVLAEIVQNADDTGASYVEVQLVDGQLIAMHDGRVVTLADALSLATPWLTTKTDDALATGRFGIGLMTHRAISEVLDVHSGPYHMRLGAPSLSALPADELVVELPPGATAFSMPIRDRAIDIGNVAAWLDRWDDSALLFLRHVRRVTVIGEAASAVMLSWSDGPTSTCLVGGHELQVERRHATARDGRAWLVHAVEAPIPEGVSRMHKASPASVPLGLALPLQPQEGGVVYAGLPLVETSLPLLVNAQFDPVTGRTDLASVPWNRALLPLLADLWVEVVEDLFIERPALTWDVVPLPGDEVVDPSSVVGELEGLLLRRARHELAERAAIIVRDVTVALTELAVEDAVLERVVSPDEVASFTGLKASLPASARDPAGRWRAVLDDWRGAGAPLPAPVTVKMALPLVEDPERSVEATIALTAAAIDSGLADDVAELACVVTASGAHIVPPTAESLQALLVIASPLAEQLGLGVGLASAHLADVSEAETVLAWLRRIGAVIDDSRNEVVVRRLAAAGQAGNRLPEPLTDAQLRALRDAFEQMPKAARDELGADVGLAITIGVFGYDAHGEVVRTHARPMDVYLSRAIDKEPDSFATAAGKTPGLLWTENRYATRLRSDLGRTAGLGAQRFLRLLGAEMTPRLVAHRALYERFASDRRLGLDLNVTGSPPGRRQVVRALGASHTLGDRDSPDLRAVATNIANEPDAQRRRERATALIGAIGRGWDRLQDEVEVTAAEDYYGWQVKGSVRAFWLWSVGSIAWLDDTDGIPQAPLSLRLRTAGTVAVHGRDAPGYLRPEFDAPNRRDVLAALGVSGEPSTHDLVGRLRELRDASPAPEALATEAAIVYQALAERLTCRTAVPGDLTDRELQAAFDEGAGLIHTNLGWARPTAVLSGPAVFRDRRAFVPQVRNTEVLWTCLHVRPPSLKNCLDVVSQMARPRRPPTGDDVVVLLETLRLVVTQFTANPNQPSSIRRRLNGLPLWTTKGWTTDRPVYALDDPTLVEGLRDRLPIWEPGGQLSQFVPLLKPLRVSVLPGDSGTVGDPDGAIVDADATEVFAAAVSLLQEDLARNDPAAAGALDVGWDRLRAFEVREDPDLWVRVDGLVGGRSVVIDVPAKADVVTDVLFLRSPDVLGQMSAGRAIAGLFAATDRRRLAQAWVTACLEAEAGRKAQLLVLAQQRAAADLERSDREVEERTEALAQDIADRQRRRAYRRPVRQAASGLTTTNWNEQPAPVPPARQRVLVDPATLAVLNPDGRQVDTSGTSQPARRSSRSSSLPQPNRGAGSPQGETSAPDFTPLDKETVGLALARVDRHVIP